LHPPKIPEAFYEGDPELSKTLFEASQHGKLYDEIGCKFCKFGWYGLIIVDNIPYILSQVNNILRYKSYPSIKSAKKAWDHVCIRHEGWFIAHDGICQKDLPSRKQS
jgi:hypothetical protein